MKKKIAIAFLVFMVLLYPIQAKYMEIAEATVITKVASAAAKQMAKVPIRDITKDIAFEMALQAIGQSFNEKSTYKFEEGYDGYCMTEIKADGSCGKVVQIKKNLSATDLSAIDSQVDTEIDKAITGGAGLTKWQKFLDWFLPIWLVSAAATAITYAVDSDVRSLFNEIGYNTLVALGLIKPVTTDEIIPIEDMETTPVAETVDPWQEVGYKMSKLTNTTSTTLRIDIPSIAPASVTTDWVVQSQFASTGTGNSYQQDIINYHDPATSSTSFANLYLITNTAQVNTFAIDDGLIPEPSANVSLTISKNGQSIYTAPASLSSGRHYWAVNKATADFNTEKATSITTRAPYKIGSSYYADTLLQTSDGDEIVYQVKSNVNRTDPKLMTHAIFYGKYSVTNANGKSIIYFDEEFNKEVIPPPYAEIVSPIIGESEQYEKEGKMAFVPPSAIPYIDADTGEQLTRTPNEIPGSEPIFTRPDGTIVPDDKVTVGEPTITPDENGVPHAMPTPTPTNPTPQPIPLVPGTPTEPTPDGNSPPPPPPVEEPPLTEFPEGESCQEKLKFPIFSPLQDVFTTSFPFSIPWDIGRAIEAAFGDIGTEKPEFEIVIDTAGINETFTITTPAIFDDWKPFTDSLLVFTFDVLIMFGIFRFVKGAGS